MAKNETAVENTAINETAVENTAINETAVENTSVDITETERLLQEMKAQVIAEAKAEAEAILKTAMEEATAMTAPVATVETILTDDEVERREQEAYGNELVSVTLFRDNDKYKADVYVAVNDDDILITRGQPVMIKRKFAEALRNSEMQNNNTFLYDDNLQNAYLDKADKF